jgi:hypothetical protein
MAFTGHDREYDASTEMTKHEKRCENHWKCVMCIMPAIGFVRAFVDEKALARHLLYPKKQPATFEIKFAEKINVFVLFL